MQNRAENLAKKCSACRRIDFRPVSRYNKIKFVNMHGGKKHSAEML